MTNAFTLGSIHWQNKGDRFAGLIVGAGVVPDIISNATRLTNKVFFSRLLPRCYRNTPTQAHPAGYRLLRFLVFLIRSMLLGLLGLVTRTSLNQRAVGSMQLRLGVEFAKRAFRLPNKAGGLLSPLTRNRAQNYRRDVSSIAHPFSNDGAACSPQYLEAGLS